MNYTVKKLAEISGVSVRTLHFYDEIGLLKPAYIGENNYRYYQEEQLLLLQQILFYREIGVPLNEIQGIILSDNFDKVEALQLHKKNLMIDLDRTNQMIMTIDKTIAHLRGETKMRNEEFYYGFDSEVQKEHEKTLVSKGIVTQEFLDDCNAKVKNWTDKEKNEFIQEIEAIMAALTEAMVNGVAPSDKSVQELMRKHFAWLQLSWTPTKEKYLGLIDLYQTPDFRVFYDKRHPDLLVYIVAAMREFAERELS